MAGTSLVGERSVRRGRRSTENSFAWQQPAGRGPNRTRHAARGRIAVIAAGRTSSSGSDGKTGACAADAPRRGACGPAAGSGPIARPHAGNAGAASPTVDPGTETRARTDDLGPRATGAARERCRAHRYGAAPRSSIAAAGRAGPSSNRARLPEARVRAGNGTAALPGSFRRLTDRPRGRKAAGGKAGISSPGAVRSRASRAAGGKAQIRARQPGAGDGQPPRPPGRQGVIVMAGLVPAIHVFLDGNSDRGCPTRGRA